MKRLGALFAFVGESTRLTAVAAPLLPVEAHATRAVTTVAAVATVAAITIAAPAVAAAVAAVAAVATVAAIAAAAVPAAAAVFRVREAARVASIASVFSPSVAHTSRAVFASVRTIIPSVVPASAIAASAVVVSAAASPSHLIRVLSSLGRDLASNFPSHDVHSGRLFDRILRLALNRVLHERQSSLASRLAILRHVHVEHVSVRLELIPDVVLVRVERDVSHEHGHSRQVARVRRLVSRRRRRRPAVASIGGAPIGGAVVAVVVGVGDATRVILVDLALFVIVVGHRAGGRGARGRGRRTRASTCAAARSRNCAGIGRFNSGPGDAKKYTQSINNITLSETKNNKESRVNI